MKRSILGAREARPVEQVSSSIIYLHCVVRICLFSFGKTKRHERRRDTSVAVSLVELTIIELFVSRRGPISATLSRLSRSEARTCDQSTRPAVALLHHHHLVLLLLLLLLLFSAFIFRRGSQIRIAGVFIFRDNARRTFVCFVCCDSPHFFFASPVCVCVCVCVLDIYPLLRRPFKKKGVLNYEITVAAVVVIIPAFYCRFT